MTIRFTSAVDGYAAGYTISTLPATTEAAYIARGVAVSVTAAVLYDPSNVAITSGTIGSALVESIGLRDTIRRKGYAKISVIGDSITRITTNQSGVVTDSSVLAYANHMQALSRGRLLVGRATGQDGANTAQVAALLPALLAGNTDDAVFWFTGANEINVTTPSAAGIVAGILAQVAAIRAAGKIPITATILPQSTAATAAQVAARLAANTLLRAERDAGRLLLVDWDYLYQQNDGTIPTTISYDGVHPSITGAERMGQMIVDYLLPGSTGALSPTFWAPVGMLDTYVTNGVLAGTAGSKFGAGVTGNVATSWGVGAGAAAGDSCVCSKVASTDADQTDWQQMVITAGSGGVNLAQLQQQLPTGQSGPVSFAAEIEITAADDTSLIGYFMKVASFAGATTSAYFMFTLSASRTFTAGTRRLFLKSPEFTITTAESANMQLYIGCQVAANKSVTMKIRRVGRITLA